MTGQVEENLLRIQKESGIVNKLNDRLNKQQETVDNIDKKIPQISQHFSQENAEQLLQSAMEDEKEVQEKVQEKLRRAAQQKQLEKDW